MTAVSQTPLVSAIIPTYNRAAYLVQAVESALAQSYPALEIVVVDDGSTDGTREALTPYLHRIRYIYQDNQGEAVARNTALAASKGELIAFLDSDDIWLPGRLETQVELLHSRPDVGMVAAHATQIDGNGKPVSNVPLYPYQSEGSVLLETLLLRSPLPVDVLLVWRECLPSPLPFTPGVRFGSDWEMCLRVAAKHPVWFLDKPLAGVRVHDDKVTNPLADQAQVDLKLRDRLGVLERVTPLLSARGHIDERLCARTEAVEYVYAAIGSYANAAFESAASRLAAAIRLDPAVWQGGEELVGLICHYAILLARKRGVADALRFLHDLFAHLPRALKDTPSLRREVYGRVHIGLAFEYHRRRESREVRRHVLQGVINHPAQARNLGVVSMLGRSLVAGAPGVKVGKRQKRG